MNANDRKKLIAKIDLMVESLMTPVTDGNMNYFQTACNEQLNKKTALTLLLNVQSHVGVLTKNKNLLIKLEISKDLEPVINKLENQISQLEIIINQLSKQLLD